MFYTITDAIRTGDEVLATQRRCYENIAGIIPILVL